MARLRERSTAEVTGLTPANSCSQPGRLQLFAAVNPVTSAVDLSRNLAIGGGLVTPLIHYLIWWAALTTLFTWLAVRRYQRG